MYLDQVPEDASPEAQKAFECAQVARALEKSAKAIAALAQENAKKAEALTQHLLNIKNSNNEEEEEEEEEEEAEEEEETVDFGYDNQEDNDEAALDHVLKIQENSPN